MDGCLLEVDTMELGSAFREHEQWIIQVHSK